MYRAGVRSADALVTAEDLAPEDHPQAAPADLELAEVLEQYEVVA